MTSSTLIIIVDDDEDDRLLIREALKEIDSSLEVLEAENSCVLLTLLNSEPPPPASLVLLDMNMPLLNGLETFEMVKSNPALKSIPFIMLTTADDERLRKRALEMGFRHFYTKPCSIQGLTQLAQSLITDSTMSCYEVRC